MRGKDISHSDSLRDLITDHRDSILNEIKDRLESIPKTSYQGFVTQTEEGQRRLVTWVDLMIGALEGRPDPFFDYQKHSAYFRSAQGMEYEFVLHFYQIIREVLNKFIKKDLAKREMTSPSLFEEFSKLNNILFQGFSFNLVAFIKTREEDLNKK